MKHLEHLVKVLWPNHSMRIPHTWLPSDLIPGWRSSFYTSTFNALYFFLTLVLSFNDVHACSSAYQPIDWHHTYQVKRDYVEGLHDTLDLVPIGAWHGNGRKAGWQVAFLPICKWGFWKYVLMWLCSSVLFCVFSLQCSEVWLEELSRSYLHCKLYGPKKS